MSRSDVQYPNPMNYCTICPVYVQDPPRGARYCNGFQKEKKSKVNIKFAYHAGRETITISP